MVAFVNKAFRTELHTYEEVTTLYQSIVSSIIWIARQVAPVLVLPCSLLGRVNHQPPIVAFSRIKRPLRFLKKNTGIGVTYRRLRTFDRRHGDYPELRAYTDASLGDERDTRLSQGGGCLVWCQAKADLLHRRQPTPIPTGTDETAATDFWSHKSRRVCESTSRPETEFASKGSRVVEYRRMFVQFLGVQVIYPTRIYVDNAAVVLHTYINAIRRFAPASKAHDIEQKYLVDAVMHQVVEVCDIDGKYNPADMMTKVATVMMMAEHRDRLHGDHHRG